MTTVKISKIEAAIQLGWSVELIDYFTKNCPKSGENIILPVERTNQGDLFLIEDLMQYKDYLSKPWPKTKNGKRPQIPNAIRKDIKTEANYACAICGHMENGEIAHIEAVSSTLNNSPENLILLCPNHHSQYDYGYKSSSNITIEEVRAAKILKRNSRKRMLLPEANAITSLKQLINTINNIENTLKSETNENLKIKYLNETKQLLIKIPEITKNALESAKRDSTDTKTKEIVLNSIPNLVKMITRKLPESVDKKEIRDIISDILKQSHDIIDIEETYCPNCRGMGTTGVTKDLCTYCKGSCFVSTQLAANNNSPKIKEVETESLTCVPTIRIDDSGTLIMSEEELEISLLEISYNIKDGVANPFKINLEAEDKIREKFGLAISKTINHLEERKLILEKKISLQKIEEFRKEIEDKIYIFFKNLFIQSYFYNCKIMIKSFRDFICYNHNQDIFSYSFNTRIEIYNLHNTNFNFSIYLTLKEMEILPSEQKETIRIFGYNHATEISSEIRYKKLIPAYIDFLYNTFSKHNFPIPIEAASLSHNWFFSLG